MAKADSIELTRGGETERIPILYEDRSVLAIDKPAGWMLVPAHWQRTERDLQTAIESSIGARDFWARSRNLKFLRYVHRLDAETSGVLLLAKSPGAVNAYSNLFEEAAGGKGLPGCRERPTSPARMGLRAKTRGGGQSGRQSESGLAPGPGGGNLLSCFANTL